MFEPYEYSALKLIKPAYATKCNKYKKIIFINKYPPKIPNF